MMLWIAYRNLYLVAVKLKAYDLADSYRSLMMLELEGYGNVRH